MYLFKLMPLNIVLISVMSMIPFCAETMLSPDNQTSEDKIAKLESKLKDLQESGNLGLAQSVQAKIADLKGEKNSSVLPKVYQKIANSVSFGSSQVTKEALVEIMRKNRIRPEYFVNVDLRAEPHIFINGKPRYLEPLKFASVEALLNYERHLVSDINSGKPVSAKELSKSKIGKQKIIAYNPIEIPAGAQAATEEEVTRELGVRYIRIPNDDHACPNLDDVYLFIRRVAPLLRNVRNTFLIHCNGGQGRTTVYAIILDMLINAKKDPLDAIIQRQAQAFSPSLLKGKEKSIKKNTLLNHVYDYIRANKDHFQTPPSALAGESCDLMEEDDV